MNTRGLLLSKALLEEGEAAMRAHGLFAASIGLLMLHDAVECALRATATHIGAVAKNPSFTEYWKLIADLPMEIEMDRLNRARVDLKHHLNTPAHDDVEEHFRNARALLSKIVSQFYAGLDFDTLSEVSIVPDSAVRARLESAERAAEADQIGEALTECAHARKLMLERQSDLFSQSWLVSAGLEPGMPPAADKRIRSEVAHLKQEIRELSGVVFAQTFGLNLMDYRLLREILPTLQGTQITFSAGMPDGISRKTAHRCIQLLARYAIRLDRELSAAKHPSWNG